jgi:hypothetical protein
MTHKISLVIIGLLAIIIAGPSFGAEQPIYKYRDAKGGMHFTQDINEIPPEYREEAGEVQSSISIVQGQQSTAQPRSANAPGGGRSRTPDQMLANLMTKHNLGGYILTDMAILVLIAFSSLFMFTGHDEFITRWILRGVYGSAAAFVMALLTGLAAHKQVAGFYQDLRIQSTLMLQNENLSEDDRARLKMFALTPEQMAELHVEEQGQEVKETVTSSPPPDKGRADVDEDRTYGDAEREGKEGRRHAPMIGNKYDEPEPPKLPHYKP